MSAGHDLARYDRIGEGYRRFRQPDPRLAARIHAALGDARTVVNVGAGAGSYEPADRRVIAVEPSRTMLAQRPEGSAPAVRAGALRLPFRDGAFAAALAVLTVHHWAERAASLREVRRVARRVVLVTVDPAHPGWWLTQDYLPEVLAYDRTIFPTRAELEATLGECRLEPLPVPRDCVDGFLGAYWARPERYLDPAARAAISSFHRAADLEPRLERLRVDLASGAWHARHGHLLGQAEADLGYRLVVAGA